MTGVFLAAFILMGVFLLPYFAYIFGRDIPFSRTILDIGNLLWPLAIFAVLLYEDKKGKLGIWRNPSLGMNRPHDSFPLLWAVSYRSEEAQWAISGYWIRSATPQKSRPVSDYRRQGIFHGSESEGYGCRSLCCHRNANLTRNFVEFRKVTRGVSYWAYKGTDWSFHKEIKDLSHQSS